MGIFKDASEGPSGRNHLREERSEAIRVFVLGHFERESETGVLVPICSESEFHEHLNVKWNRETGEIQVEASDGNLPLISSKDEWLLAIREFRGIQNLAPEPLRSRAIAKMQLAKNTDDWLASFGEDNPASMAMIGERALQRWEATADPFQLELAKEKFKKAATLGDSQAAYRLATYQVIDDTVVSNRGRYRPTYLEEDSGLRDDHKRHAAKSGHPILTMDLEKEHFFSNSHPDPWEIEIENQREELNQINGRLAVLSPLAEQGDTAAQLDAARLLGEKISLLDNDLLRLGEKGLIKTESDLEELCPDWGLSHDRRKAFLYSAATNQPEAKFLLVSEGIEQEEKEALRLLRSAAFPPAGEQPFAEALILLAKRLIQAGELVDAERCLRQAINNGLEARLELADLLFDHAAALGREGSEAVALYEEIAAPYTKGSEEEFFNGKGDPPRYWFGSAKAALRAGLAYLRGSGVVQDMEKARRLFGVGAKRDAWRRKWVLDHEAEERGFDPASLYCEIALLIGWGGDEPGDERRARDAIRLVFERLSSLRFAVESGDVLCVDDFLTLVNLRPESVEAPNQSAGLARATDEESFDHESIQLIAAIRMLSEPSLTRDEIKQSLRQGEEIGNPEMLIMLAGVHLADRFGEAELDEAEKFFKRAIEETKKGRRKTWWREDRLAGNETRQERLVVQAERGLRACADIKTALERAQRETEKALAETKMRVQVEVAKRKAVEDMMAMFAHKFRGPVDSILFNTTHRMEPRVFADAARTMNGLLDIFSIVSTGPDKLVANLQEDTTGPGSPESVLVHSLKLALIQLLSQRNRRRLRPHYFAYTKRIGRAPTDLKLSVWDGDEEWQSMEQELQVQWESDLGRLAGEAGFTEIASWMEDHLIPIRIDGFASSSIRFAEYGPNASLLTVIFTEVLVNAIKHSEPSASNPIILSWDESSDPVTFCCSNPSTRASRQREASKGSGRGHNFLSTIAGHVGGKFSLDLQNQPSSVTFSIPWSAINKGAA